MWRGSSGRHVAWIIPLGLIALAVAGLVVWRVTHPDVPALPLRPPDPRLTFATPFRNVRPDVQYVGDTVCARCHDAECRSYREHPMGRSLAPASDPTAPGPLGPDGRVEFEANGFHYRAERRDGRLFHRETVPGPDGKAGDSVEVEIGYVIGSGRRGAGYLFSDDGTLFQSAMSWYSGAARWDLSPGYHERHSHMTRPITADCLFCHCNRVEPVADTVNRYRDPIFRGHAIGCERCHGPGGLHVRERDAGLARAAAFDDSIVNPRHLEPPLREAVCQQCHLQGQARVLRDGRGAFDYRPGLPLELFWAVYVLPPDSAGPHKAVGQVEQMHQSRCFIASEGRLGCISCHDPHRDPPAAERPAFYRGRCLTCHQPPDCTAPAADRRQKADACATCHMSRLTETDIVHVAVTDHRVLRVPLPASAPVPASRDLPVVAFHTGPHAPGDRDLGLALLQLARRAPPGESSAFLLGKGLPLVRAAAEAAPDDVESWEQLATALLARGQTAEALAACEAALERTPTREGLLTTAADAAAQLDRAGEAEDYLRRAVAVSPRRWEHRYRLGQVLAERAEYEAAIAEFDAALKVNPASVDARLVRVACLFDLGRRDEARTAFEAVLALKPPRESDLRRWFDAQMRRAKP